jgi:segregation and condensation protein B
MEENLSLFIEALILGSENSINQKEIQNCLEKFFERAILNPEIEKAIEEIRLKYDRPESVLEMAKISGGYQFLTKKKYAPAISILVNQKNQKKLSTAAMETLAIIAYQQPITKSQIEEIRGVNCDYSIQKLLEKELIQIDGKSEGPGRPLIYSTSRIFMDYFKLDSLNQLPQIKDLQGEMTL